MEFTLESWEYKNEYHYKNSSLPQWKLFFMSESLMFTGVQKHKSNFVKILK